MFDAAFEAKRHGGPRASRPMALFHIGSGGCEACAVTLSALEGAAWDMRARGFWCVDMPQEADLLLVTGPVTRAMAPVLERAWTAMPGPKGLVAVGDCAVDGGLFVRNYATLGGLVGRAVTDVALKGCPPSPGQILEALLALVG
jgi:Ni,Fe-hydrogenase III small subunit